MRSMAIDLLRSVPRTKLQAAIWATKLAILLAGVASAAALVRLAVPFSRELVVSTIPRLYASARGYLAPPYLFITINFIILTILKLSDKKQHNHDHHDHPRKHSPEASSSGTVPSAALSGHVHFHYDVSTPASSSSAKTDGSSPDDCSGESCVTTASEDTPSPSSATIFSGTIVAVKKTVKKSVKRSEKEKEEKQQEEKEHDSIDTMWKAISSAAPAKRHLKKSDTWVSPRVEFDPEPPEAAAAEAWAPPPPTALRREMRKSETFNDSAAAAKAEACAPPPPTALRWEMRETFNDSLSTAAAAAVGSSRRTVERRVKGREVAAATEENHDDMNRQFEAFIKKVNDQMRLQRQESYRRQIETVNRGR